MIALPGVLKVVFAYMLTRKPFMSNEERVANLEFLTFKSWWYDNKEEASLGDSSSGAALPRALPPLAPPQTEPSSCPGGALRTELEPDPAPSGRRGARA